MLDSKSIIFKYKSQEKKPYKLPKFLFLSGTQKKKKKKKTPKFESFLPTYYQKKDHINPFFILIISALPIKNNTLKMNACTIINM